MTDRRKKAEAAVETIKAVAARRERKKELSDAFKAIDRAPLRPDTLLMSQSDLDDIAKWGSGDDE